MLGSFFQCSRSSVPPKIHVPPRALHALRALYPPELSVPLELVPQRLSVSPEIYVPPELYNPWSSLFPCSSMFPVVGVPKRETVLFSSNQVALSPTLIYPEIFWTLKVIRSCFNIYLMYPDSHFSAVQCKQQIAFSTRYLSF